MKRGVNGKLTSSSAAWLRSPWGAVACAITVWLVVVGLAAPVQAQGGQPAPTAQNPGLPHPGLCISGSSSGTISATLRSYAPATFSKIYTLPATVPAHTTVMAHATGTYRNGWSMLSWWAPGLTAGSTSQGMVNMNIHTNESVAGGGFSSNPDSAVMTNSSGSPVNTVLEVQENQYGWGAPTITATVSFYGIDTITGGPSANTCPTLTATDLNGTLGKHGKKVADPISPASGNYVHAITDIAAPSGIYGLSMDRTYNSMDANQEVPTGDTGLPPSIVGPQWSTPYDISLLPRDDLSVSPPGSVNGLELRFPDGQRVDLTTYNSATMSWTVPAQIQADVASVTWDAAHSQLVVTLVDGEAWRFDSTGAWVYSTSPDGQYIYQCSSGGANIKIRHGYGTPPAGLCSLADTDPAVDWQLVFTDANGDGLADSVRLQHQGPGASDPIVDYTYAYGHLLTASAPHVAGAAAQPTVIATAAGTGTAGYSGDNGPSVTAQLHSPYGLAVDSTGAVYVADSANNLIRRISGGTITTYAGTGTAGHTGDGGPAVSAELSDPTGLAFDASDNLYVADTGNKVVREITRDGTITTIAGTGASGNTGDGGLATAATFKSPQGVAVDPAGNIYVADTNGNRVRQFTVGGNIAAFAGTGASGFSGDGGPAVAATLNSPIGLTIDPATSNLYIADFSNNRVRLVSGGNISTYAGNGSGGFSGDGGAATSAKLHEPASVALDANGALYIADRLNHRVRKVTPGASPVISTVAGSNSSGYGGDYGSPTAAMLSAPTAAVVDSAGALWLSDTGSSTVRTTMTLPGETYLSDGLTGAIGMVLQGTGSIPKIEAFNHYDDYGRVDWQNLADGDHVQLSYGMPTGTPISRTTTVSYCTTYTSAGACTGTTDQYTYVSDEHGQSIGQTDATASHYATATTLSSQNQLQAFEDRAGNVSGEAYDSSGRPIQFGYPDPSTGFLPPLPASAGGETCVRSSDGTFPTPNTGSCAGRNFSVATVAYCSSGVPSDASRIMTTTDATGSVTEDFYGTDPGNGADQCYQSGLLVPTKVVTAAGTAEAATATLQSTNGLVTQAVDPDGIETDNVYNSARLLISTTVGGHTTYYGYDPLGRQVVVRNAVGDETWTTYDASNRVLSTIGPVPVTTRTCTPAAGCNFPTTGLPDVSGPSTSTAYGLDGTKVSSQDQLGKVTNYSTVYTNSGGQVCLGAQPGCSRTETTKEPAFSATDARRITTVDQYDTAGDLLTQKVGDPTVPADVATTTYTYSQMGRVNTMTSPAGVMTTYHYDQDGNLTGTTVGPSGSDPTHTTTTEYDHRGRVTRTLGPSGDADETGATAQSCTQSVYDAEGRVIKQVVGTNTGTGICGSAGKTMAQTTWTIYDPATGDARYTVTDPTGTGVDPGTYSSFHPDPHEHVAETTYTAAGRVASTIEPPVDVSCYNWAAGTDCDNGGSTAVAKRVTLNAYYENTDTGAGQLAGQLETVTDSGTGVTTTTYYPDGRLEQKTTPGGNYQRYAYDDATFTTTIYTPSPTGTGEASTSKTNYANGALKSSTDASGGVTTDAYYGNGLLYAVTNPLGNPAYPTTDVNTIRYTYDTRGNRTSRIAWSQNSSTGTAHQVTENWTYNLDDQTLTDTDDINSALPVGSQQQTVWHYDSYGRNDTITKPSGRVQTNTFWGSGLVKQSTATQSGQPTVVTSDWYTAQGSLSQVQAPWSGTEKNTVYTYDHGGNVLSQVAPDTSGTTTVSVTRDLTGEVSTETYPDGVQIKITHDPLGRQLSSSFLLWGLWIPYASYTYNGDGKPTSENILSSQSRAWTLSTNGSDVVTRYQQTIATSPAVVTDTDMSWRANGQIASQNVHGATTKTVYGYDAAGQLTCSDTGSGTPTCPTPSSTCAGGSSGVLLYTYGPRGNRYCQSTGGTVTSYTTNDDAGVSTAVSGSATTSYSYDADGNRTVTDNGTASQRHTTTYDARGYPVTLTTGAANCGQSGQPACVSVEDRIYDGQDREVHTDGTSSLPADIVWNPASDIPQLMGGLFSGTSTYIDVLWGTEDVFAIATGGNPLYYAYDNFGSAIYTPSISDPTSYDPYGNPQGTYTGAAYRGESTDLMGGVDLVNLQARDYDPTTGTFTSMDPLDGVDGTTTTANPYAYVYNDPLNQTDPTGMRAKDGELAGGLAIALDISEDGLIAACLADPVCAVGVAAIVAGIFIGEIVVIAGKAYRVTQTDGNTDTGTGTNPGTGTGTGTGTTVEPPPPTGPLPPPKPDACPVPVGTIGAFGSLPSSSQCQRHHIIQDAAVRGVTGYSYYQAPAIELTNAQHAAATSAQNAAPYCGTYDDERQVAELALRAAGDSAPAAALGAADDYFIGGLGLTLSSPLPTPRSRRNC